MEFNFFNFPIKKTTILDHVNEGLLFEFTVYSKNNEPLRYEIEFARGDLCYRFGGISQDEITKEGKLVDF